MEDHLNTMGCSDREEARILEVFNRGLLREFPNPDRQGCPLSEVLRRVANHEMPLSEAEKWLDHLGSCSPCYRDYLDLQAANRKSLHRAWFAVAAGILLSILAVGRILFPGHHELPPAPTTAVLDLRNRSVTRGAEQRPAQGPLGSKPLCISVGRPTSAGKRGWALRGTANYRTGRAGLCHPGRSNDKRRNHIAAR